MNSCCVPLKELLRLMSFKKKAILEDHCASLALANTVIYEVRWQWIDREYERCVGDEDRTGF